MADIYAPRKRSSLMASVPSKGNFSTELRLAKIFRREHFSGWRRHGKLPGKPDFVFEKQHVCVFVHGCFWHGCPRCGKGSKTNSEFWSQKFVTNKKRDGRVTRALRAKGYSVLTIWECSLRKPRFPPVLRRLKRFLRSDPKS